MTIANRLKINKNMTKTKKIGFITWFLILYKIN